MAPESQPAHFLENIGKFGSAQAMVVRDETYDYNSLVRWAHDWGSYLDSKEIQSGQVVALEAIELFDACACILALVERGNIIVPLTMVPATKQREYHEVAEVEVLVRAAGSVDIRHCVFTGRSATHELYGRLRSRSAPGLVLFSSGTSGRSKASVLDFAKVLTRYGAPTRPMRILSFLNLDHIGGINTLFHTFSQSGTAVAVADRSPDGVFATIAKHRVAVLPTTPTFLNMLLVSGAHERHDTSSLELITYGTEPMPPPTLRRLREAFPKVRFKQTYGLSELGILPTKSRGDDSVWIKLGDAGFEHKVVDGVLWIRSAMAMLGYLNAEAPFDDEGFFNTQDLVEQDGEYVRILGRCSEIINVGGEKVYPSEVESVLVELPNVSEATVSGRSNPVTGMVVVAKVRLVTPEEPGQLLARLREHCRGRLEPFKIPVAIDVTDLVLHSDRFKKVRGTS